MNTNTIANHQQAIEAEKIVLGMILLENGADHIDDVLQLLTPQNFYEPNHNFIFSAILELRQTISNPDMVMVNRSIRERHGKDMGLYMADLMGMVASSSNIMLHARKIYEEYCRRILIAKYQSSINHLQSGDDVVQNIEETDHLLTHLIDSQKSDRSKTLPEAGMNVVARMERIISGKSLGYETGVADLDKRIGGWKKGDVSIVAARPGMGKSDFMLFSALSQVEFGRKSGIISLEMSSEDCLSRLTAMNSEWTKGQITGIGDFIPKDTEGNIDGRLLRAISLVSHLSIIIEDNCNPDISRIRHKIRELIRKGCDMIFVDYLQLAKNKVYKNTYEAVSDISKQLKHIAKEFNIPIIALCQLSRAVETRGGDKRPINSDLRDSGQIEQDASDIIFLYRPEYYGFETDEEGNSTKDCCELIVSKARHGITGTVKTQYKPNKGTFLPLYVPF